MLWTYSTLTGISGTEVAYLLKGVVCGLFPVMLVDRELPWHCIHAGEVEFDIHGYRIWVFNDADSLDYIDAAESPDGRRATFEGWQLTDDHPGRYLSWDEWKQLESILRSTR